MSGPGHALRPRVARLEDGRFRAEVVIADLWGTEDVFRGGVAATEAAAFEAAARLVATALVVEEPAFETPPPWK
jgi:hypothetical protein